MGQKEYYDGGSVVKSVVKLFDPHIHPIPTLAEHASPAHGKVDTGDWGDAGDVRWGDGGDVESPLCLPEQVSFSPCLSLHLQSPLCLPEQVTYLSGLVSLSFGSGICLVPPTSRAVDISRVVTPSLSITASMTASTVFSR